MYRLLLRGLRRMGLRRRRVHWGILGMIMGLWGMRMRGRRMKMKMGRAEVRVVAVRRASKSGVWPM